jgi:hypothetical protein
VSAERRSARPTGGDLKAAGQCDLLIIDGPARTSKGTLAIAQVADLVVQPTGASVDDLRPAVREFHALVKEGVGKDKLAFALNRIGTAAEEGEARAYIAEAGYAALAGCLLERPAYRKAQNTGHAVTETSYAEAGILHFLFETFDKAKLDIPTDDRLDDLGRLPTETTKAAPG